MTTLEPFDLDPDDERLSRYLDGDLTAEEIVVLERDLAADPHLADRLAALRRISEWLALPPEPAELAGIDHAVERALHAYDERDPAVSGPAEPEAEAPVAPVIPLRARQWWARPQLWTAAAALALVAAVAALAVRSDTGEDTSSETAAVAERSSGGSADGDAATLRAEAADEGADHSAADAASAAAASQQPASAQSLEFQSAPVVAAAASVGTQDHADLDAFFDATSRALATANDQAAQPPPSTALVVPTTAPGVGPGPPSTPAPPTTTTGSLSASAAGGACADDYPNTATVGGRPVRWRVSGAEGSEQGVIEVVDAATCETLGSRPA